MENMEKITWRIWESNGLGKALLIGGIVFYIPVINLILLGYLGCWARQLVLRRGMALPDWSDGRSIFNELGRVILPFAAWVFLPFALAGLLVWGLSGLLVFLGLGLFAHTVAWLPMALVALLSPLALTDSLIRLYRSKSLREAMAVPDIMRNVIRHLRSCLFPLFQYYGILAIGWPLLGFAIFLATLPLIAQLVLVFGKLEDDLKMPAY